MLSACTGIEFLPSLTRTADSGRLRPTCAGSYAYASQESMCGESVVNGLCRSPGNKHLATCTGKPPVPCSCYRYAAEALEPSCLFGGMEVWPRKRTGTTHSALLLD